MSELKQDIRAHARAHVKELTKRTTELVGEVIAKGMVGVLEECIAMHVRIQELEAELARRTQPEATKPAQDESGEDTWRRLALQFDGHRMMALSHLRAVLQDAQKHAPLVEAFLKAPPMNGEAVLAQRIAALASPADALVAGDRVAVKDVVRNALELYADCYDRMERQNPNCYVPATSVAYDIRKNMIESTIAAIQAQKDGHGHD